MWCLLSVCSSWLTYAISTRFWIVFNYHLLLFWQIFNKIDLLSHWRGHLLCRSISFQFCFCYNSSFFKLFKSRHLWPTFERSTWCKMKLFRRVFIRKSRRKIFIAHLYLKEKCTITIVSVSVCPSETVCSIFLVDFII